MLLAGWYLLNGPLGRPDAALPWVTLVVGVHFFALALVFRARAQHFLGASLTVCGVVGLALAVGGAPASSVALTAGICPGFVLLAFSLWDLSRARPAAGARPSTPETTSDIAPGRPPTMGVSTATAAQVAREGDTTTDPSRAEPVGAWGSRRRYGDTS